MSRNSNMTFQGVAIDPAIVRMRKHAFWAMGTFLGLGFIWVAIALPFAYFNDPLDFPMVLGLPLWAFLVLFIGGGTALIIQLVFAYAVFNRGAED